MDELTRVEPVGIQSVTTNCRFCGDEFVYTPVAKRGIIEGRRTHKGRQLSKRTVCDRCRNDRGRPGRIERFGKEFADWPNDRAIQSELERRHVHDYIHGIKIQQVGPVSNVGKVGDRNGVFDWLPQSADSECEHGRRPGDPCPSPRIEFTSKEYKGRVVQNWPHEDPCGCWNGR